MSYEVEGLSLLLLFLNEAALQAGYRVQDEKNDRASLNRSIACFENFTRTDKNHSHLSKCYVDWPTLSGVALRPGFSNDTSEF